VRKYYNTIPLYFWLKRIVLYREVVCGNLRRYGLGELGMLSVVLQHMNNKVCIFFNKLIIIFVLFFKNLLKHIQFFA